MRRYRLRFTTRVDAAILNNQSWLTHLQATVQKAVASFGACSKVSVGPAPYEPPTLVVVFVVESNDRSPVVSGTFGQLIGEILATLLNRGIDGWLSCERAEVRWCHSQGIGVQISPDQAHHKHSKLVRKSDAQATLDELVFPGLSRFTITFAIPRQAHANRHTLAVELLDPLFAAAAAYLAIDKIDNIPTPAHPAHLCFQIIASSERPMTHDELTAFSEYVTQAIADALHEPVSVNIVREIIDWTISGERWKRAIPSQGQ